MKITDVRVKLVNNPADRLKAYCTVTLDDVFVVRDVKVVEGTSGLFIAMPSRKLSAPCGKCGHKNHLRAHFCNECGAKLPTRDLPPDDSEGRSRLHRDIAHPITTEFRHLLQDTVVDACLAEQKRADDPNYKPVDLDDEQPMPAEPKPHAQPETTDEVSEEDEEQEVEFSTISEYDALIKDLAPGDGSDHRDSRGRTRRRGGTGNEGTPGRARRTSSQDDTRAERDSNRQGGKGKRGGRKRGESRREQPAEKKTAAEKRTPPPVAEPPKPEPAVEQPELAGFGMGILDESSAPNDKVQRPRKSTAKPKKAAKSEKAESAPKEEDKVPVEQVNTATEAVEATNEDTSGFGAGIL